MRDILRTHEIKDHTFEEIDSWVPILHDIFWKTRSTYRAITQASSDQLVFGRNMLLNILYTPDWDWIEEKVKA